MGRPFDWDSIHVHSFSGVMTTARTEGVDPEDLDRCDNCGAPVIRRRIGKSGVSIDLHPEAEQRVILTKGPEGPAYLAGVVTEDMVAWAGNVFLLHLCEGDD